MNALLSRPFEYAKHRDLNCNTLPHLSLQQHLNQKVKLKQYFQDLFQSSGCKLIILPCLKDLAMFLETHETTLLSCFKEVSLLGYDIQLSTETDPIFVKDTL